MKEEKRKEKIKRILTTTGYTTELNKHEVLFYIEDLERRIEKAIEYIEWERDNPTYDNVWREYEANKLIEILKGAE